MKANLKSLCATFCILFIACQTYVSKEDELKKIDTLIKQGKTEKAIARLNKNIKHFPKYGDFYAKRGDCYFMQTFYLKAIEDYLRAMKLRTNDTAGLLLNLGNTYAAVHKDSLAIEYFQKSLVYKPNPRIPHLIDSLIANKNHPLDIWGENITLSEVPKMLRKIEQRLAERYLNYYNIIRPLDKILRADSTNSQAYFIRALSYGHLFFYAMAINDNMAALKYNHPKPELIYYNLGCNYLALEKDSMARIYFNKVSPTCYSDAIKLIEESDLNNVPWDYESKKFHIINSLLKK